MSQTSAMPAITGPSIESVLAENERLQSEIDRLLAPKRVTRRSIPASTSPIPVSATDRIFAKTHPKFEVARKRLNRHMASVGAPLRAVDIASFLNGPGGVPEFIVAAKNLPNRMLSFGLVKVYRTTDGMSHWWRPDMPVPRGYRF